MPAMSPRARNFRATKSDVLPDSIPAVRPRRSAAAVTFGVNAPVDCDALIECQVGP